VIFQKSPNITRLAARDILVNFEISLVVFIPNTPRNHAISYTYNNLENSMMKSLCRCISLQKSKIGVLKINKQVSHFIFSHSNAVTQCLFVQPLIILSNPAPSLMTDLISANLVYFKHCSYAGPITSSFLLNFAIDKWPSPGPS